MDIVTRARLEQARSLVQMTPLDPISVVVTTYNRSDALAAVLGGLAAQDDSDFEIIIADDGSLPHHVKAIEQSVFELGLTASHVWHPDIGFTGLNVRDVEKRRKRFELRREYETLRRRSSVCHTSKKSLHCHK